MNEKVNILVVDDRPEGIMAVQAVLDRTDYNIVTASSGQEALRHLLDNDFAVILLDVQMPILNGFETAAIIKTRDKSKDIPIIFMSAINQDEMYVYQGYEAGAVDYLLKPFDPYILKSKVAVFVDIYRKKILIKQQSQKLIENELRLHKMEISQLEVENLKRYRHLADSIPQIVFRVNNEGAAHYFNQIWYDYTGLVEDMQVDWHSVIHPEDLPKVNSIFESDPIAPQEFECRILSRKGTFRWHLLRLQPEFSAKKKGWLGTATDIEDRKLREEISRYLSDAGEILISSLDHHDLVLKLMQHSVPFLGDWSSFDYFNDNSELEDKIIYHRDPNFQQRASQMDVLLKNPTNKTLPYNIVTRTKQAMIFNHVGLNVEEGESDMREELAETSALIVPVVAHKKIIGIMSFYAYESGRHFDQEHLELASELGRRLALAITNSQLYKLSQQAIEIRNQFLSIASHELNTPITSLKLQLQLLAKSIKKAQNLEINEAFEKSVTGSIRQVDRLINLVQVLLDVSHIQSGKFGFKFEEFDVAAMANEVINRHAEVLANANCTVELKTDEKVSAVWDKTRIEQVIINLVTNAIKYAPGKIEVQIKKLGEGIKISVRDHGKGIPKNKLNTIFDRFERVGNNESIGGLGLGLFIVKQIVEGHKGHIEIDSEIGKGSCFNILLPPRVEATVA